MKEKNGPEPQRTSPIPEDLAKRGGGERFGRFQLAERLGAGVSHDTWRAWEDAGARWVALRVWPRPTAADRASVSGAVAWAKLGMLPEFPAATGAGLEGGKLWIARPFVEGATIREMPDADTARLVTIARDAARALAALHAGGRVHGHLVGGNLIAAAAGGVALTDAGLAAGSAVDDVASLGRDLCDVFGLPGAPGDPATAKGRLMGKGDTTKVEEPGPLVLADERLAGILTRARAGQMDAAVMATELEAWQKKDKRPPSRRGLYLVLGGVGLAALLVVGAVMGKRSADRKRFQAECAAGAAAESEGRLDESLRAFRAAELMRPADARVHEAVVRVEGLITAREARRAEEDARAARLAEVKPLLDAARAALASAQTAAAAPSATRASIDRSLEPAYAALRRVLDVAPQMPEAIELAWGLADLGDQGIGSAGTFARLPGNLSGATPAPVPAFREAFRNWYLFLCGPRAASRALRETSVELKRLGIYRGWMPSAGAPVDAEATIRPLFGPLEAVERSCAAGAPELRYTAAFRSFLKADVDGARAAFRDALQKGAGEFSPDVDLMLALLDEKDGIAHARRGLAQRPWDLAQMTGLSEAALDQREDRLALETLERALLLHPGSIDLRLQRGWIRYAADDVTGAFEDADAIAARDASALVLRSGARFKKLDFAGADADALEALRRQPENVSAHHALVGYRLMSGPREGLEARCDASIAANPELARAWLHRSMWRIQHGTAEGAASDAEEALRLHPGDVDAWMVRALARAWMGDDAGAMADADASVKSGVDISASLAVRALVSFHAGRNEAGRRDANASATAGGAAVLGQVAFAWGLFIVDEDPVGAEKLCDKALESAPGNLEAIALRSRIRYMRKRSALSLEDADAVLAVRPGSLPIRMVRVYALSDLGRQGEAIREADLLVEQYPQVAGAWVCRASARHSSDGRPAVEDLDQALKVNPEHPEAVFERSQLFLELGQTDAALALLDRYLATPKPDGEAYRLRAACREVKADYAGAVLDYTEAMRAKPLMRISYLLLRGSANLKAGKGRSAAEDAAEILRASPNDARVWWIMAEARRIQGQKDLAGDAYRKVLEVAGPGDALRVLAEKALKNLSKP